MQKKNITIAVDSNDYQLLEKTKKDLKIKSFSQLIVKLMDFYDENKETVDKINKSRVSSQEKIDQMQQHLLEIKDKMVSQQELSYLKSNLDLIKQNYDVVQSLMNRLDKFQDSLVTQNDYKLLQNRIELIENFTQNLTSEMIEEGKSAKEENKQIRGLLKAKQNLEKSK